MPALKSSEVFPKKKKKKAAEIESEESQANLTMHVDILFLTIQ